MEKAAFAGCVGDEEAEDCDGPEEFWKRGVMANAGDAVAFPSGSKRGFMGISWGILRLALPASRSLPGRVRRFACG
jgi:hypothetical protein